MVKFSCPLGQCYIPFSDMNQLKELMAAFDQSSFPFAWKTGERPPNIPYDISISPKEDDIGNVIIVGQGTNITGRNLAQNEFRKSSLREAEKLDIKKIELQKAIEILKAADQDPKKNKQEWEHIFATITTRRRLDVIASLVARCCSDHEKNGFELISSQEVSTKNEDILTLILFFKRRKI